MVIYFYRKSSVIDVGQASKCASDEYLVITTRLLHFPTLHLNRLNCITSLFFSGSFRKVSIHPWFHLYNPWDKLIVFPWKLCSPCFNFEVNFNLTICFSFYIGTSENYTYVLLSLHKIKIFTYIIT